VERDWEQANTKNDTAALERILAPEFVSTDSDGRLVTRAEMFARRKSGAARFSEFAQDDYKVHMLGDTAVVTGRSTLKGQPPAPTSEEIRRLEYQSVAMERATEPVCVSRSWC
jgi:ketosteroid isomerase-like protein